MIDLKGKKLLVLGGNALSCDIITTARSLGVYTIVTDWYDSRKSPAKLIADEFWNISIENYEELVRKIREEHIDGIFTNYTDSYLIPYSILCKATGLPCLATERQINTITNKDQSKQLCIDHGIPVPRRYEFCSIDDVDLMDMKIRYPVLTKPVDQSGQRGIFVCNNKNDLKHFYYECLRYSASGNLLVEEYLSGDYVVMFYTIQNGKVSLASMADKPVTNTIDPNQVKLPKAYILPSKYVELCRQTILPKVQDIVSTLGLDNGVIGIEGVVVDDVINVFEMQFRLGGMRHHEFVLQENKMNIMEMFIRFAITGKFEGYDAQKFDNANFRHVYCLLNVLVTPGTISKIEGVEKVLELPCVTKYTQMAKEGDAIELVATVQQIFCKISLKVSSFGELENTIRVIHETLKVYDEKHNDMIMQLWN